ncbi:hypothetical protein LR48_Vigan07g101300 [Vigna angularis]|uniref:Uncharacterized protein n=1 Tax=Phaseolus angularis TaxID=3914 RepID=A0A0L9UXM8_PHAAN|nr:hypothetical protein LR48_Vigan07g101300 [Vigna angularis]
MVEGGGCILDGMQSGPCSEQVVKKVEVREGPVNVVQVKLRPVGVVAKSTAGGGY